VGVESVDPTALGLPRVSLDELRGGDATVNAAIARDFLGGKVGPVRDAVLLNAAGAVAAYEGLVAGESVQDSIASHLPRVAEAVDSGAATALLDRWIALSQEIAQA
jgi:anthranilate phosphoribosyltransferase